MIPAPGRYPFISIRKNVVCVEALAADMPIRAELKKFEDWNLEPIQLNRPVPAVERSTFGSYIATLSKFLGFVQHFYKLRDKDMSMALLTNQLLLLEYLGFQLRVLTSCQAVTNHVAHLSRLLTFLGCTVDSEEEGECAEPMRQHVGKLIDMIHRVRDQAKKSMLAGASDTDASDNSWMWDHLELPSQAMLAEWQWMHVARVRNVDAAENLNRHAPRLCDVHTYFTCHLHGCMLYMEWTYKCSIHACLSMHTSQQARMTCSVRIAHMVNDCKLACFDNA